MSFTKIKGKYCARCGSPIFTTDTDGYYAQCFECDEDLYSFETVEEKDCKYELSAWARDIDGDADTDTKPTFIRKFVDYDQAIRHADAFVSEYVIMVFDIENEIEVY